MILTTASVFAGVLIVLLTQFDIMATVLHPEIESPLSSRFQRFTWKIMRLAERIGPRCSPGNTILNWGLPLMVVGLIAVWLVLLAVGFALIYYPWINNTSVFVSDTPVDSSLLNALYYSGVTLATLGFGDIQPISALFRMLAVIEAGTGAVTISFAVAYVLAIYPTLAYRRTIAVALDAEVAGQADALPMVRRYLGEHGQWHEDFTRQLRDLGLELLAITESHETHPVLYYAHPRRVQHSFLRILVTAQSLIALLRYGLSPDQHRDIVYNPHVLLLEQSLHYSLHQLSMSLHIPPVNQSDNPDERKRLAMAYDQMCDQLEHMGLVSSRLSASRAVPVPVAPSDQAAGPWWQPSKSHPMRRGVAEVGRSDVLDPALDLSSASSQEAYSIFRLETDCHIAAYAVANGYSLDAARADNKTTWWVGA